MFEWNWADLIIAFLGFLTAIGAAFFTNKILDYIKCKKTVNKIKKELEQEFEDKKVEENINRILSLDDHNFKLVEMPYIESVCKSNLNECVMNIFWFCDLITIVNSIDEWYYSGIAERLDKVKETNAFKEYIELLFEVFGWKMLNK